MKTSLAILAVLIVAACTPDPLQLAGPFYLMPRNGEMALYRCPNGPRGRGGCGIDGLPGPPISAAGADKHYVVVAQEAAAGARYYYFARLPQEGQGWGVNPEKIIGPLGEGAFLDEKRSLGLPDFSLKPWSAATTVRGIPRDPPVTGWFARTG